MRRLALLLLLVLAGCRGCNDEPGKLRGNMSTGSAKEPEPSVAVVVSTGDALMATPVSVVVKRRIAAVPDATAVILGDVVEVRAPEASEAAVREALTGNRADLFSGEERIVRGESLGQARSDHGQLVITLSRSARRDVQLAVEAEQPVVLKVDGDVIFTLSPADYEGLDRDAGTITVKHAEAGKIAERLSAPLSHVVTVR